MSKSSKEYNRLWELRNRANRNEYRNKYLVLHRDRINKLRRLLYLKNRDFILKRNRIANKKYYEKNKQKIFQYHYNRIEKNDFFRMKTRLRSRLYKFLKLKGFTKKCKFNEYVGCSPEQLRIHLEKRFLRGMKWSNYGLWHIDHIIPISVAKTEKSIYRLFHFSNLQPLWALDNISKSNKYNMAKVIIGGARPAGRASSNPSKATSRANLNMTFGKPMKPAGKMRFGTSVAGAPAVPKNKK